MDADPRSIIGGGTQLSSTTQYYAKSSCAGCSATQFDIYTDSALTIPASYSVLANTSYATFAEACPAKTSVTLPGAMYTDTTALDSNNQPKIRCFTIRLANEPDSSFAARAAHSRYPHPTAAT